MNGAFLSCDWGTSQFRLRWVELPQARVIAEINTDQGVGRLAAGIPTTERPKAFRACLAKAVETLIEKTGHATGSCPIVISGMASSTIGWRELPYATLPFALDGRDLVWCEVDLLECCGKRFPVFLLSGVKGTLEIMRGEETQLIGLADAESSLAAETIVLLPGTHSKHALLRAGRLVDFSTWLTGELYQVLCEHSVLRHSVAPLDSEGSDGLDWPEPVKRAFLEGVQAVKAAPLLEQLFKVRTRQVLAGVERHFNSAFLSGLLTGSEVLELARRFPADVPIILCGGERLTRPYQLALTEAGLGNRVQILKDPSRLALLGQIVFLKRKVESGACIEGISQ